MSTDVRQPELITTTESCAAVVRGAVSPDGLRDFFDQSFGVIGAAIKEQQVTVTGPAYALYHGVPGDVVDLEVGFPTDRPIEPAGSAEASTVPGGRVARLVHEGGYDDLGDSWGAAVRLGRRAGSDPGGGHVGGLRHRAFTRCRSCVDADRALPVGSQLSSDPSTGSGSISWGSGAWALRQAQGASAGLRSVGPSTGSGSISWAQERGPFDRLREHQLGSEHQERGPFDKLREHQWAQGTPRS